MSLPPLPKALPKLPSEKLPSLPKAPLPKSPGKLPSLPKLKSSEKLPSLPKGPSKPTKDPSKYLDTFFGKRNGIVGNPKENVNYTKETLTYMSSKSRADETTDIIVKKMNQLGNPSPFPITECCAGIGGNTLSFLENPNISSVISYEIDPERRKILKNNIDMYKLGKKSTIRESFSKFDKCENCVGFLDAPWLSEGIKGTEATKEQYILSGMKVGDKTLEQIISESNLALIAMKVPLDYQLAPVQNIIYENVPLKNSLLILAYPAKTFQEDKWLENLKKFLRYELLPRAISSPESLDKLVSDEAMKIWEVAFTSESYNPNVGENYEEYEFLGDKIMGAAYARYMLQSYPGTTRSELSELNTYYLAKSFQSKLSASLGIGKHIRSRFRTTTHMLEDVLEAIFGALVAIGDSVFRFGAGFGLAYNLLVSLYKDVEIDWDITLGNPKTRVKQIFEQLQWIDPKKQERVPEETEEDERGNITFIVKFPKLGISQLQSMGIRLQSSEVARATANTKKKASNEAYRQAVRNLRSMGITDEAVVEIKKRRDFENPDLAPYIAGVSDKLKAEGFSEFYLNETHVKGISGKTTAKYVQMVGVKPDGKKVILSMTEDPIDDVMEGKKQVLTAYANSF